MPARIIRKQQLSGTTRHVRNEAYETYRLLLDSDRAEVTVTDIVLAPGVEVTYGYDNHIEIAYCIEGQTEPVDLADGQAHAIAAGTLRVA